MTALPVSVGETAVREAVGRLSAVEPGPYEIVSCYLKLEPRDKARAKYLIKIKNRIKQRASDLERRPLDHAQRESVRADLDRLRRYFEEPSRLPAARGIALFACDVLDLFETLPLPHVHRSRLAVDRKSTRLNSSHRTMSYAVLCLKKKNLCRVDCRSYVPTLSN